MYRLRRDGRTNGTAILRRSSTTPFNNQQGPLSNSVASLDTSIAGLTTESPAVSASPYVLPTDATTVKYTRDELLELAMNTTASNHKPDVNALMMAGFSPGGHLNGASSRLWGKNNDPNGHNDPTMCWDTEGRSAPLGSQNMSSEEKEVGLPRHVSAPHLDTQISAPCASRPV